MMSVSKMEDSQPVVDSQRAKRGPAAAEEHPGRFALVVTIVVAILLSVNAFVGLTLGTFFGWDGWGKLTLATSLFPPAFAAATIIGFRRANEALRFVYGISAAFLGALNFLFFAAVACWLVEGIALLARIDIPLAWVGALFFGAALTVSIYGVINAAWLRLTPVTIALPNLPTAWAGRTIALVTDVHLGHLSGPGFLRRIIQRLRTAQPDMVLISGDLFDGTTVDLARLVAPWKDYSAPRGIYYVTGNHDEFAPREIYLDAVAPTGVRVLNNEKIDIDGLQLIGVHDSEAGNSVELRSILRRAAIDPARPSILLSHQPSNLRVAEEAGVSLQLSGHTHSGQLWPWNLVVRRMYGSFAQGLSRLGNLQVYTSNGTGTWGPPLRVGTKSEIILIRLEAAK